MNSRTRAVVLVGLALACLLPGVAPWLAPGALVFLEQEAWRRPIQSLVFGVIASLCFWSAAFWALPWVGLPLSAMLWPVGGLTAAALLVSGVRTRRGSDPVPGLHWAAILLSIELLHRFFLVWGAPVPPGADMSMHAYITRLIWAADGVPGSYLPLLDIADFRTFPVGFHVMGALTSHSLGVSVVTGAAVVSAVGHGLVAFGVYALLRFHHSAFRAALVAVLVGAVAAGVQRMVGWGGNPTVLGLALMAPLYGLLDSARTGRVVHGVLAGMCALALFLTHTLIFVQCVWVMAAALIPDLVRPAAMKRAFRPAAAFLVAFAALGAPYLLSLETTVSPTVIAWIEDWVRTHNSAWKGEPANALWTVPAYLVGRIGFDVMSLLVTGGALLAAPMWVRRDRAAARRGLTIVVAVALLVVNTHLWWLPASYAIYPERVAAMCIIPIALSWGAGLDGWLAGRTALARVGAAAGVVMLVLAGVQTQRSYRAKITQHSLASVDDLAAIAWIEAHTPEDAVIGTNYGDAGLWIPALAGRKVSWPHVNVSQWSAYRPVSHVGYLFVGSRPLLAEHVHWTAERVTAEFPGLEPVFESGASRVYRVEAPAWPDPEKNPFESAADN